MTSPTPLSPSYGEFRLTEGRHWRVDAETGCWQWIKGIDRNGYAFGHAHRRVYVQVTGADITGLQLHHRCHNTACVNPDHLQVMTASEHQLEHCRERSPLTEAQVVEIRERAFAGEVASHLAEEFGISVNITCAIANGDIWTSVGGPIGKPQRNCMHCGAPVVGRRRHARFCKPLCQVNYNSRKARAEGRKR
jgi:hypothetical protein